MLPVPVMGAQRAAQKDTSVVSIAQLGPVPLITKKAAQASPGMGSRGGGGGVDEGEAVADDVAVAVAVADAVAVWLRLWLRVRVRVADGDLRASTVADSSELTVKKAAKRRAMGAGSGGGGPRAARGY